LDTQEAVASSRGDQTLGFLDAWWVEVLPTVAS
jgi:hypothetical protein